MQLKIKRTQKTSGMLSKSAVFMLDARLHLTPEETDSVRKYKLGDQIVYSSEDAKKHAAEGLASLDRRSIGGLVKAYGHLAAQKMALTLSINKLLEGAHIECKDLNELLGAENAIQQACENTKLWLDTAATFDGREVVFDFDKVQ